MAVINSRVKLNVVTIVKLFVTPLSFLCPCVSATTIISTIPSAAPQQKPSNRNLFNICLQLWLFSSKPNCMTFLQTKCDTRRNKKDDKVKNRDCRNGQQKKIVRSQTTDGSKFFDLKCIYSVGRNKKPWEKKIHFQDIARQLKDLEATWRSFRYEYAQSVCLF